MSPRAANVGHLVRSLRHGLLCTNSVKVPGHPFGSLAPYALDADGRPLFLLSALAVHTRNLRADPRASLLVAADAGGGDPLASARANLFGTVVEVEASAARDAYLAAHPDAAQWVEFGDFAVYRLEVSNVYYVAGFGEMGWVSGADYANAITS
jgi:putative heme iron utilization protein